MNSETQTAENLYYRDLNPQNATPARRDQTHGQAISDSSSEDLPVASSSSNRASKEDGDGDGKGDLGGRSGQPAYLFSTAGELNRLCEDKDFTIAQVVWENELAFRSADEIKRSLMESEFVHIRRRYSTFIIQSI